LEIHHRTPWRRSLVHQAQNIARRRCIRRLFLLRHISLYLLMIMWAPLVFWSYVFATILLI
jgi:hypothetical protein